MAKRTLGLGKAAKAKKQKAEEPQEEKTASPGPKGNEIHVELDEEVDPNDELAQLKGLWETYIQSDRANEMVLNGIIHECDRLLRNQTEDTRLPAEFHSTYALALADLANFHTEDDDEKESSVKQYFDAALERIEVGQEQYPDSIELGFAKAGIIFSRIPLEFISQWDVETKKDSTTADVAKLLDEALESYQTSEESVKLLKNYKLLDKNVLETLKALDDLLDIITNFGKEDELAEGLDSDDEDEAEKQEIKLSKRHPLYKIHNSEKYFKWLIIHGVEFGDLIGIEYKDLLSAESSELGTKKSKQLAFFKETSTKIGQLLLQAAEKPSGIFTAITYDSDVEGDSKIEGYTAKEAQKEALEYTKKAVDFFKNAEDEEDPNSWVDVAEALIDLGNLYDYESREQVDTYSVAEKRLRRANNATNGKYQEILDNLLNNDD
jgi:hypothetical protein